MSQLTHCLLLCPLPLGPSEKTALRAFEPENACLVAVDGGLSHFERLKLEPHVWIGDGDSLPPSKKKYSCQKIKLTRGKDYSDLEGALHVSAQAMFKGVWDGDIAIFGAQGGRFDHDLSNMFAARKWLEDVSETVGASNCPNIYSFGAHGIWASTTSEITFAQPRGKLFSVFTFNPKVKVKIQGAKYNVRGKPLVCASHGLSNEGVGKTVRVSAAGGPVFVVIPAR